MEKSKKPSYRDADILLSLVLIGIFGYTAWDSYRMSAERIGKKMATLSTAPGLIPFIVSLLIIICSLSVIAYAVRQGGAFRFAAFFNGAKDVFRDEKSRSTVTVFLILFLYIFGFIGNLPFVFATLLYVLLSFFVFKAGKPVTLTIIAVLYSAGVVLFFARIVGTNFPVGLFIWR